MPFFLARQAVGVLDGFYSPGRTIARRFTGYMPVALNEAIMLSGVMACFQAVENSSTRCN